MPGCRSLVITLLGLAPLAVTSAIAGGVGGTVSCGDRCADFVVFVEGVGGSWNGAGEVVELGQRNKLFVPHVVALLKGSTLRIGNDDPFMHNVHARRGDRTIFNLNILFQYQTIDQVIAEAGVYRISCEPHPEMSAVIVALDNPFFTRPDKAGRFGIPDLPPGSYRLVSFDAERDRRKTKRVRVGEGVVIVDF